jgi:hypothetical protein
MRPDPGAGLDLDLGSDHGPGSDGDVGRQSRRTVHLCAGMDQLAAVLAVVMNSAVATISLSTSARAAKR